jgi:serine/threonine-protein kinase
MPENPLKPGDIVMGKYRVEQLLGMGSMGIVVAATHEALQQRVAIKILLQSNADPREQYERFKREARAAGRLKSPHVTKVLDVGTLETGTPYLVMEHLEGRDLGSLLTHSGPLPMADAVEYILQVCEAVGEAHAAGIIHRDIKPTNLFLTLNPNGSPCIKVIDFGISKTNDAEVKLTKEAEILGSPLYMSPEQMDSSRTVDARSDVWALGVTLYELLSTMTPFHAAGIVQVCNRVFQGQPTPLSSFRPDLPAALEAVILRCFEKDRDRRWPNVAELAAALAPFASANAGAYVGRVAAVLGMKLEPARPTALLLPEPVVLPIEVNAVATTGSTFSTAAETNQAAESGRGRSTRGIAVTVGLGFVVVLLAGVGAMRWSGGPAAGSSTAATASAATFVASASPATSALSLDTAIATPPNAPSIAVAAPPVTTAMASVKVLGTSKPAPPPPIRQPTPSIHSIATAKVSSPPPKPSILEKD